MHRLRSASLWIVVSALAGSSAGSFMSCGGSDGDGNAGGSGGASGGGAGKTAGASGGGASGGSSGGAAGGASAGAAAGASGGASGGASAGASGGSGGTKSDGGVDSGADANAAKTGMSFFVTSRSGGGNLGGLTGADTICNTLATTANVTGRTWRAYLSTTASGDQPAVNARDRIKNGGPWYNQKGVLIAANVDDLHEPFGMMVKNKMSLANSLTEKGAAVPSPMHDIITGSTLAGMAAPNNCMNWTSDSAQVKASVGHSNRAGGGDMAASFNAAHDSNGCSQAAFMETGGAGKFYCFAID